MREREANIQTETEGQTDRQAGRWTYRQRDRDKQVDRKADT